MRGQKNRHIYCHIRRREGKQLACSGCTQYALVTIRAFHAALRQTQLRPACARVRGGTGSLVWFLIMCVAAPWMSACRYCHAKNPTLGHTYLELVAVPKPHYISLRESRKKQQSNHYLVQLVCAYNIAFVHVSFDQHLILLRVSSAENQKVFRWNEPNKLFKPMRLPDLLDRHLGVHLLQLFVGLPNAEE